MAKIIGNTTATPNPQPDWEQTNQAKADYIKNKPTILTEDDVKDLIEELGGDTQVQADWAQTATAEPDYIKNKPTLGTLASKDEVTRDDLSEEVQESIDAKANDDEVLHLSGGELTGTLKTSASTPLVVGTKGKIGMRAAPPAEQKDTLQDKYREATGNQSASLAHVGQINISNSWWNTGEDETQDQWGAQMSGYNGKTGKYNELRVSHEGVKYKGEDDAWHEVLHDGHKGMPNGVAELDDDGIVPRSQLPEMDIPSLSNYVTKDFLDGEFSEFELNTSVLDGKLYLIKDGVEISSTVLPSGGGGGSSSSAITLTDLMNVEIVTVSKGQDVNLQFYYSSDEDKGNGKAYIYVEGERKGVQSIVNGGNNTVNVSQYLGEGITDVKIVCSDRYSNSKSLTYTVNVINLYITSTFNDAIPYDSSIIFKYIAYGAIDKQIHIIFDGDDTTVPSSTSGQQATYTIPRQSHGVHTLEVYSEATIGEDTIESDHLKYEIVCLSDGATEPLIASIYNIESLSQGELVEIPYIVYDPMQTSCNITLSIASEVDGEPVVTTKSITVDRTRQYWRTRQYPTGTVTFTITYEHADGDVSKSHILTVTESTFKIEAVTDGLELHLSAAGRSNTEANRDIWDSEGTTTTFENINWATTGWCDDNGDSVLRLFGDATATINFQPFKDDLRVHGKTLEFEFAIRDVNNRNAVVVDCMDGDIGLQIMPDHAEFKSEQTTISCHFKEEERVRIAFVVESTQEHRLISIYLNGVLSVVKQYPIDDNFQQLTASNIIIGSPYCGIDIYNIRSYASALTSIQVNRNYIADTSDITEKRELYDANDIYDSYGKLSYAMIKTKIPVMTIIGSLPQSKGDKKNVVVKYVDYLNPSLNFEDSCVIDVQGTSSQWYVVKNYKNKYTSEHQHALNQLPSKIFCMKADYAESTGTHNTHNANLIHTLYSELTPAQQDNAKCRTTIYGFPCVIFHQETLASEPTFVGKYNFNYDKGSESVFGFTDSYVVESWEFCNNTSDVCNFLGKIQNPDDVTSWINDFEPRYSQTPLLDDTGKQVTYITAEGKTEKAYSIAHFKEMHDWVVSTKNNLEKFKNEFENYFDLHFSLIYYVYTFVALMVDQRAKNMFLTYWGETGKWQPWFYDNDTCFGINNEGQLVFDYYHEDTDRVDDANVYNGQNSVLWTNFRQAFADKIQETYQELRSSGKLTYNVFINNFITNGADKWSASIYNEDSEYKYISMLKSENDAGNLEQVRGTGKEHLKYFIENRLNYCDSKWYATDYADDYVVLRIYTPRTYGGVAPNANITVTPYSNMYAGVRYKANGTLQQLRATKNVPITFEAPTETFNDTETAIYGASELSSLGDLAPLYCGYIKVDAATKLTELKVGDGNAMYKNKNLHTLSVGTNKLLKKIDVRNCPNLTNPLELTNCPAIEEIYAQGSGITGIGLADSGYLKIMHLPATIANLTLRNQLYLETFTMEGYNALKTLSVEKCPAIDVLDILQKSPKLERVRLIDVDWELDNVALLKHLITKGVGGIDDNGFNTQYPYITGKCHITLASADELQILENAFPYLDITYDGQFGVELIFRSYDDSEELYRYTLEQGTDGVDPVRKGLISEPCKDPDTGYTYSYVGWNTMPGQNSADENALKNVTESRTVYVAFEKSERVYTVEFYNHDGSQLLHSYIGSYGSMAQYTLADPVDLTQGVFVGWVDDQEKDLHEINGEHDKYYARFVLKEITAGELGDYFDYEVDEINLILTIKKYKGNENETLWRALEIRNSYTIEGHTYNKIVILDEAFTGTNIAKLALPEGVTSIGDQAFKDCTSLTSIVIPDSVTSIGKEAFRECISLTSVVIPDNVESIGEYTFYNCESLTSITIPDNVTSIGSYAFYYCTSLPEVIIPESVSVIGEGAFYYCASLESITLPESITTIEQLTFGACESLTSVVIPDSVTSIGHLAFGTCYSLTSIEIPDSVTSIDDRAFENCTNLTSIEIPNSVMSIGSKVFGSCTSLTRVVIPASVTNVGADAFTGCSELQGVYITDMAAWCRISFGNPSANPLSSAHNLYLDDELVIQLTIPDNVASIGAYAFYGCTSFTSITIPASVTSIGQDAFSNCTSLENIEVSEGNDVYESIDGNLYKIHEDTSMTLMNYAVAKIDESFIIPDNVTIIGNGAFYGCSRLTSIVIPDSVTYIGGHAFNRCSNLTSVTIGNSVTSIDEYAFAYCASLTSITFEEGSVCTHLGMSAFQGGSSLTSIQIPASVIEIGSYIFSDCYSLTSVMFGENSQLTHIRPSAFYNCKSLTNITIPDGVIDIGNGAFNNCTGLTSIQIPASVTNIGGFAFRLCTSLMSVTFSENSQLETIQSSAFQDCTSLTSIVIPDSVTWTGNYLFWSCIELQEVILPANLQFINMAVFGECRKLTSITLPNTITHIDNQAFSGCTSLESITIPDSVTYIDFGAFKHCTGLQSVTIGNGVTSIGYSAFEYCGSLTSITIPDSVTTIGDEAFRSCHSLTSVTIGNGVKRMQARVFFADSNLQNITIGKSVIYIGASTFGSCTRLSNVYITDMESWCQIDFATADANPLWIAPNLYLNGTLVTDIVIPNSMTHIKGCAFYNYKNLTALTILSNITEIRGNAFRGCENLATIYNLSGLEITCGSTDHGYVGQYANNIYTVIPNEGRVWNNGNGYIFYENGDDYYLVNYVGEATDLTLPADCKGQHYAIYPGALYNSSNLATIQIASKVLTIGNNAFGNCTALTTITIPNTISGVGDFAFKGCSALANVTIGTGVSEIQDSVFEGCIALTSVEIPGNILHIRNNAFKGCGTNVDGVCSIRFQGQPDSIASDAFSDTSETLNVYVPWDHDADDAPVGCPWGAQLASIYHNENPHEV